jgi:hypothetical protein
MAETLEDLIPGKISFLDLWRVVKKMAAFTAEQFIPYVKYVTAWPMAMYLKNDTPVAPVGFPSGFPLLFSGGARRYLRNLLKQYKPNGRVVPLTMRLVYNWLISVKRAAERVGEETIQAALVKHSVKLTQAPAKVSWFDQNERDILYKRVWRNMKVKKDLMIPSANAAFESTPRGKRLGSRKEGGGKEIIREKLLEQRTPTIPTPRFQLTVDQIKELEKDLISHGISPLKSRKKLYVGGRTVRGPHEGDLLKMVELGPGDVRTIVGMYDPTWEEAMELVRGEPIDVMVAPVTEPIKVRLITKGNSVRYWIAGHMQRAMFAQLRKFPQFALIGEPVSVYHLVGMMEKERRLGLNFPNFNSGDYTGATDGQDSGSTHHSFETALWEAGLNDKWTTEEMNELRKVIYEQRLNYPPKSGIETVMQTNGQLMGSVLSFPILCSVNLVCYWRALNRYLRSKGMPQVRRLRDLPVLINGDDILFRSDPELYAFWREEIEVSTFDLSLGKNYVHPTILTINSVCFEYLGGNDFRVVPYMNNGLLIGEMSNAREAQKAAPIWEHHNMVVSGARDQIRAHKRFMHYHKEQIKMITSSGKLNLFLPLERGGCGFNLPSGWKLREESYASAEGENPYITQFQRKFATYAKEKTAHALKKGRKPSTPVSLTEDSQDRVGDTLVRPFYHQLERAPYGPLLPEQRLFRPDLLIVKGELITPSNVDDSNTPSLKYKLPTWADFKKAEKCEMMTSRKIMWYGGKRLVYRTGQRIE